MKKKHSLFLFISLLFFLEIKSQNFYWAKQITGVFSDFGYGIAVDGFANAYTIGTFNSTNCDFDPGPGTFTMGLTSAQSDAFIIKLGPTGNFIWAIKLGGTGAEEGKAIAADAAGNIVTTGYFNGVSDFDPTPATSTLSSSGSKDVFICKLSSAGTLVWVKKIGGTGIDQGNSITLDASGNVYTTGYFSGTVDFDPGPGTYTLNATLTDVFISKLDVNGNFVWATQLGGSGDENGNSIAVDVSGNVLTTGTFSSTTADFDPGPATFTLGSAGAGDIFISKLDASGNFMWANAFGGSSNEGGNAIDVDPAGNVYSTGYLGSTNVDFDPAPLSSTTLSSAGSNDIYITKYDPSGNFSWCKRIGGSTSDTPYGLKVDAGGNVFTCGSYSGSNVDFDPGPATYNFSSIGFTDIYIMKLNTSGNFIWADRIGFGATDNAFALAIDASSEVYTTGQFASTVDFDPATSPYSYDLTGTGGADCYINKLTNCALASIPANISPAANNTICTSNSTTLTGSSTGTLTWYANATSTTVINTGPTFVTPTLSVGSYSYYVEGENACGKSYLRVFFSVSVTPMPTISITSTTPVCLGKNTSIIGSGAFTYSWNTGATTSSIIVSPTVPTSYTLMGINSPGCSDTISITLTPQINPTISVTPSFSNICVGQSILLTVSGANTYSWNIGPTTSTILVSPTTTTNYPVMGYASNGCWDNDQVIIAVSACTGIDPLSNQNLQTYFYPNPTSGAIVIKGFETGIFLITNSLGQEIKKVILSEKNNFSETINDLETGIYFLTGKNTRQKIIVLN